MELLSARRTAGIVVGLSVLLLASCSSDVDEPTFDNPFDPSSPNAGAAYELNATVIGDVVQLTWANVKEVNGFPVPGDSLSLLLTYFVNHATGGAEPTALATGIAVPTAPTLTAPILVQHVDYVPETVNSYRVESAGIVRSPVVSVDAPLAVVLTDRADGVQSLDVSIDVRSGVSTGVEIALDADFTEGLESFDLEPGVRRTVSYEIPPFGSESATLTLYHRGTTGGSSGATGSIEVTADFDPEFVEDTGVRLIDGLRVAVDDTVRYRAEGEGITGITVFGRRITTSGGMPAVADTVITELFTVADVAAPFSLPLDDPAARDDESTNWTFLFDAESELGFTDRTTVFIDEASEITSNAVTVVDPDGDGVVEQREIVLELTADGAGEFMVSEDPTFAGAVWRDFADMIDFVLSDGLGPKTIYVAYRNDFAPTAKTASASITYLTPPATRR